MVIAHNIMAMNAQRQFNIVGNSKKKNTEKLSSGYRINRAADDAAGLAISEKMRRQIRGLSQGIENTEDGIALCKVADGALSEVSEMLHRITELSVQSANGTNSDEDRNAIQQEIAQIMSEINRISDTTEFNNKPVFQGATGTVIIPAKYSPSTVNSFSVSGTPSGLSADTYRITADTTGFKINNDSFAWSDFRFGSNTLADSYITGGTYSFNYHGLQLSVAAKEDADINDAIGLLDKSSFCTGITSYDVGKASEIMSFSHKEFPDWVSSYGQIGIPSLEYKNDQFTLNTGMLDVRGVELKYSCDLKSNDFSVIHDNGINYVLISGRDKNTIIPANTRINMMMSQSSSEINSRGGVYLNIDVGTATTLGEVMETLKKCNLDYTRNDIGNSIMDNKTDNNGSPIKITASTKILSDAGYSVFDNRDIVFSLKNTTKDPFSAGTNLALVSNDGKFVLYPNSSLVEGHSFAFYTEDLQMCIEGGSFSASGYTFNLTDYHEKWLNYAGGDYNMPWFNQKMNNISIADVNIYTPVIGLDRYSDSGYKGKLVTPEQRIYSQDDLTLWIQSGSEAGHGMFLEIDRMNTNILGIEHLDVSTVDGANHALGAVKGALEKVSANRSKIGAQQNRLEHTIANEQNIVENTASAESRIRDTDMAKEMVELSKQNILEQVGTAMITQANQTSQGIMSLLQ